MILPDLNILLYAHNETSAHHSRIGLWVTNYIDSGEAIILTWPVLWGFVRIATNVRAYPGAITIDRACLVLRDWMGLPQSRMVGPGSKHVDLLQQLIVDGQATGPRVSDAVLAAIAIEYGATLVSTDRDFLRFRGLRLLNPLDD